MKITPHMTKKAISSISMPVAIIVSAILLSISFYSVQLIKQNSIEEQQLLKLQQEAALDEKEFIARRKSDCLVVYKTESDKWSNVLRWRYDEEDSQCAIRYKDPSPKSDAQCDEEWPVGEDWGFTFFGRNLDCKNGEFEKYF